MRAPLLFFLVSGILAACIGKGAAPAAPTAGDPAKQGGSGGSAKFECTDLDATLKRDTTYHAIATADAATLPARVVAEKFAFAVNDHDGDGIDDEYDLCPLSAEDGKEPHPFDGCTADADHTRGRTVWPDIPKVVVRGDRIDISEQIHFAPGSAKILDTSKSLVAAIAQAILDNPEIEFVEIAGHADKQGGGKENVKLTNQRAKSVADALIGRGVDAKWLRAMGYGEYCPLDHAQTKAAFAKNRRVEFRIIRRDGRELTPSWGGCDEAEKQGVKRPAPAPAIARVRTGKVSTTAAKGVPEFHGSCRTPHAAECEQDCKGGSTEACYVGAHEWNHASEASAVVANRDALKRDCDAGLFPACAQLASSFVSDAPQDHAMALGLAAAPCDKGDGVGCGVEAFLLERGCSIAPDPAKGYSLAKKGCGIDIEQARQRMTSSLGDRQACGVASTAMWLGLGGAKDHAGSYALDLRACAAGLPHACLRLAQAALSEPALVGDRTKLVATLHDACEQEGWDGKREECIALASVEKPGEYPSPRLCDAGGQLECMKKCDEHDWEPCVALYISALYRGFYRRFDGLSPRGAVLRAMQFETKIDRYKDSQAKLDEQAAENYGKACTATIPSGCIHHARMRLEGRGVFRDPAGAALALDEWCDKGEKMACAYLAHAIATKKVPGGAPEAKQRMADACKAGLKRACK